MKPVTSFNIGFLFFCMIITILSCKKTPTEENPGSGGNNVPCNTNNPPVARAGVDSIILLPTDSITLNGNGSSDPEGRITGWNWNKITGPSSFTIVTPSAIETTIKNLVAGIYQFELKVTDHCGSFSLDTVQVVVVPTLQAHCLPQNRPVINAQLIPVGTLSINYSGYYVSGEMIAAAAGNKILFIENYRTIFDPLPIPLPKVDIYDVVANTWSTAVLSLARGRMSAVGAGNKIFIAGGYWWHGNTYTNITRVDIYDVVTNTWSTAELSEPRISVETAALGNKVFFAGGHTTDPFGSVPGGVKSKIDIYDLFTNTWSTATMSQPRMNFTATAAGNKVYFAGGVPFWVGGTPALSSIDVYDGSTGTLSTSSMTIPRYGHASITVGENIIWAGGKLSYNNNSSTCLVELKNLNTQNVSITNLSDPTANGSLELLKEKAFKKNNQIIFMNIDHPESSQVNQNEFDIYDISSGLWSIGRLNVNLKAAAIIEHNNIIYVAGGKVNGAWTNQVWKLEF
jgi:hypothetical protein